MTSQQMSILGDIALVISLIVIGLGVLILGVVVGCLIHKALSKWI